MQIALCWLFLSCYIIFCNEVVTNITNITLCRQLKSMYRTELLGSGEACWGNGRQNCNYWNTCSCQDSVHVCLFFFNLRKKLFFFKQIKCNFIWSSSHMQCCQRSVRRMRISYDFGLLIIKKVYLIFKSCFIIYF